MELSNKVNISYFSETNKGSLVELNDGTIDVLAGGRVNKKHDFMSSPSVAGVQFSTPFYYGQKMTV